MIREASSLSRRIILGAQVTLLLRHTDLTDQIILYGPPWLTYDIMPYGITASCQRDPLGHADTHGRRGTRFWASDGSSHQTNARFWTTRKIVRHLPSRRYQSHRPRKQRRRMWCRFSTFGTPRPPSDGWSWQISRRTKRARLFQVN